MHHMDQTATQLQDPLLTRHVDVSPRPNLSSSSAGGSSQKQGMYLAKPPKRLGFGFRDQGLVGEQILAWLQQKEGLVSGPGA